MSLDGDRVRRHTARAVLQCIDDDTAARLLACAEGPPDAAPARLRELDREWDTDRAIELEAAVTGLVGLAAGALLDPRARALPGLVSASVLLHALTGWYPLLPLFRRLGLRTAREIARERHALKALRGDFEPLAVASGQGRPRGAAGRHPTPPDDWTRGAAVPGAGAH